MSLTPKPWHVGCRCGYEGRWPSVVVAGVRLNGSPAKSLNARKPTRCCRERQCRKVVLGGYGEGTSRDSPQVNRDTPWVDPPSHCPPAPKWATPGCHHGDACSGYNVAMLGCSLGRDKSTFQGGGGILHWASKCTGGQRETSLQGRPCRNLDALGHT